MLNSILKRLSLIFSLIGGLIFVLVGCFSVSTSIDFLVAMERLGSMNKSILQVQSCMELVHVVPMSESVCFSRKTRMTI